MTDKPDLARRGLLLRLGLAAGAVYAAPTLLHLGAARASSGSSGGGSGASGGRSAPSGRGRSAPSGRGRNGTGRGRRASISAPSR